MDNGIVSVRYAKALLKYATAEHEDQQVYNEMKTLAEAFTAYPQLHTAIQNPTLKAEQVKELLIAAANSTSKSVARFIDLLIENKRLKLSQFIATSYQTLYREENHLVSGKLTVASTPSDAVVERMQQMVAKRTDAKVDFEVKVDPAIIGGFVLEYDTYRMDASVRGRLANVKRTLL